MKNRLFKFIFFKCMGWQVHDSFDRSIKKCVFAVTPHTSWHDFYIGVFARGVMNIEINYIGKKELFIFPLNLFFEYMGGAPVDRSGNGNKVEGIASIFKSRSVFRLAMSPEGTRKKVDKLRTGFYYIAQAAKVPIVPVNFNFKEKIVTIHKAIQPTGNIENDMKLLDPYFKNGVGKIAANGY